MIWWYLDENVRISKNKCSTTKHISNWNCFCIGQMSIIFMWRKMLGLIKIETALDPRHNRAWSSSFDNEICPHGPTVTIQSEKSKRKQQSHPPPRANYDQAAIVNDPVAPKIPRILMSYDPWPRLRCVCGLLTTVMWSNSAWLYPPRSGGRVFVCVSHRFPASSQVIRTYVRCIGSTPQPGVEPLIDTRDL